MKTSINQLLSAIGYFLVFWVLFLQFPLHSSLPGKIDSWFYLTAFRCINNFISHFFSGAYLGTALYPEADVYTFGNYSFGQVIFFLPFKWVGLSDIWAYHFFNTIIFTFNAYTVQLLSRKFGVTGRYAFLCGLFFACSNYALGNLDNPDALFFGFGFLAIFLLLQFFETQQVSKLLFAMITLGLELYFSSYAFLLCGLMFTLITLFHLNNILKSVSWSYWIAGLFVLFLIIYPYLHLYIFNAPLLDAYNPASNLSAAGKASLKLVDFFRPLKYNIYYQLTEPEDYNWLYKTRSAFIGIVLPALGLIGILEFNGKNRKILTATVIVFMLLAFGPFLPIENKDIHSPLYWFYKQLHINQYLRISVRAYFLVLLAVSIGAASILQKISKSRNFIATVLILLIFIENIPYKFETFNSQQWIDISERIPKIESKAVILNLPSSFYSTFYPPFKPECKERVDYEFEFMREYFYMYQQTIHKANTVNAFPGFIPYTRMNNQLLIDQIVSGNQVSLEKIIKENSLTTIIYHKKLLNGCNYTDAINLLDSTSLLKKTTDNSDFIVYKITP